MKFAFIEAERITKDVSVLCRALGVSRAGYYAWRRRGPSKRECEDARLRVAVRAIFDRSRRSYGSPRIYDELKEAGLAIGRNRVIRLMQEQQLIARPKKRWRKSEAVPESQQLVAPNILDRQFDAGAPNQRWVSDTTELRAGGLRMFLAAVMDLYSRYIVGWSVALVNDRHLVEKALKMAIKRRCPDKGLLAHSDQGCTYTSEDYQRFLKSHGIVCSMSRRGECHDNAAMESWFSTLKFEEGEIFESPAEAKAALFDYIEVFYNQDRRHSFNGGKSPAAYERTFSEPQSAMAA